MPVQDLQRLPRLGRVIRLVVLPKAPALHVYACPRGLRKKLMKIKLNTTGKVELEDNSEDIKLDKAYYYSYRHRR